MEWDAIFGFAKVLYRKNYL